MLIKLQFFAVWTNMECWEIYASPGRAQERSWKNKPEKEYRKLKIFCADVSMSSLQTVGWLYSFVNFSSDLIYQI